MDSLARNALRLSLAGAGVVVLGAGFVGQASAAELPDASSTPETPDTSESAGDRSVEAGDYGTLDLGAPESTSAPTDPLRSATIAMINDIPPLAIPHVLYIELPTITG